MKKAWRLIPIVGVPLLVLGALVLRPRHVILVVDNGRQAPARLELAGTERGIVPAGGQLVLHEVPARLIKLRATELGPGGEAGRTFNLHARLAVEFFVPPPVYVWNLDGATRGYWIVTKGYGDAESRSFPPERFQPAGELFRLPPDLLPGVDPAFPARVQVTRQADGSKPSGATRRGLFSQRFLRGKQLEAKLRQARTAIERQTIQQGQGLPEPGRPPDAEPAPR